MAERKVLNKYYPPDFNPAKIPKRCMPKNQQIEVLMTLPMSIRCSSCGNYLYKCTKFNSQKEDVIGETYLGIQIFRFYFKCTKCSSEITMKTDAQNSDYIVESGAVRNFEPWRAEDKADEENTGGDAMRSLENRTKESKREMDILAALDELKSRHNAHVSVDKMLEALQQRSAPVQEDNLEEEDEALIDSLFRKGSREYIRRIDDDDMILAESSQNGSKKQKVSQGVSDSPIALKSSTIKFSIVKKQPEAKMQANEKEDKAKTTSGNIGLQLLCQQYDDSDEE